MRTLAHRHLPEDALSPKDSPPHPLHLGSQGQNNKTKQWKGKDQTKTRRPAWPRLTCCDQTVHLGTARPPDHSGPVRGRRGLRDALKRGGVWGGVRLFIARGNLSSAEFIRTLPPTPTLTVC